MEGWRSLGDTETEGGYTYTVGTPQAACKLALGRLAAVSNKNKCMQPHPGPHTRT